MHHTRLIITCAVQCSSKYSISPVSVSLSSIRMQNHWVLNSEYQPLLMKQEILSFDAHFVRNQKISSVCPVKCSRTRVMCDNQFKWPLVNENHLFIVYYCRLVCIGFTVVPMVSSILACQYLSRSASPSPGRNTHSKCPRFMFQYEYSFYSLYPCAIPCQYVNEIVDGDEKCKELHVRDANPHRCRD